MMFKLMIAYSVRSFVLSIWDARNDDPYGDHSDALSDPYGDHSEALSDPYGDHSDPYGDHSDALSDPYGDHSDALSDLRTVIIVRHSLIRTVIIVMHSLICTVIIVMHALSDPYGDHSDALSDCSSSCPLTGGPTSSACVRGCVVNAWRKRYGSIMSIIIIIIISTNYLFHFLLLKVNTISACSKHYDGVLRRIGTGSRPSDIEDGDSPYISRIHVIDGVFSHGVSCSFEGTYTNEDFDEISISSGSCTINGMSMQLTRLVISVHSSPASTDRLK